MVVKQRGLAASAAVVQIIVLFASQQGLSKAQDSVHTIVWRLT